MTSYIGLYDDMETAQDVLQDLVDAGFSRENISIVANDANGEYANYVNAGDGDVSSGEGAGFGAVVGTLVGLGVALIPGIGPVLAAGPLAAALMAGIGAAAGAVTGGVTAGLVDLGVPSEDADYYAEGIRRGGVLVTAHAADSSAEEVQSIMERHHPIDLEERSSSWREEGWSGFDASAEPYTASSTTSKTPATRASTSTSMPHTVEAGDQAKIDIVQEELQVGKRDVERGGVRVKSYMVSTPVEESVSLREEHVTVERNPVNRPATSADLNAFVEGTIEVTEHAEEAVVAKTARVVEEVVIGKEASQRTEQIHDEVRRTEVEVEQIAGRAFETYDSGFRTHYTSNYGSSGRTYDQYMPAYRYGYTLANDSRYSSGSWSNVEANARRDWETRNQGPWEDFKDAVRHGWETITGQR
ncbi:MAG: DUF2382 domain-containing protein [Burkholderiales bacterium]|nr:DUF2382 domain-containing protein [Anaerolineae bacterium]